MGELEDVDGSNSVSKAVPRMDEIGETGLKRYGGTIDEEYLTQLKMPRCIKIYSEMSTNDPTIGAVLFVFEQLIRKVIWSVEAGGKNNEDLRARDHVDSCMHDMSHTWADFISEILSMFVYGWSWHEIVYKLRRGSTNSPRTSSHYNDGLVGWRKIPGRSQSSWYEWKYEEDGDELLGFTQQAAPKYEIVTIPFAKSLLFRTNIDRGNPEGRSLLRTAYRPWYFKKRIEEIEAIGIERELAGMPMLEAPEGMEELWNPDDATSVETLDHAKKMVRNIRRDQQEGAVLPPGWKLTLLSTGGRRQIDVNATINRLDQRIAVTLLADIVMLGADKVGSFALADVKKSLLSAALETQLQNIAATLNQYAVPKLVDLNPFQGITSYPKIVPGELEIPDLRELARFVQVMVKARPEFLDFVTENYLREAAGMPLLEKEEEEIDTNGEEGDADAGDDM